MSAVSHSASKIARTLIRDRISGLTVCIIRGKYLLIKSRITITLDPEVHRLAKQRAVKRKTTVSGLIESLLQSETSVTKKDLVHSMIGSASLRIAEPGKDFLHDALRAKYLRS